MPKRIAPDTAIRPLRWGLRKFFDIQPQGLFINGDVFVRFGSLLPEIINILQTFSDGDQFVLFDRPPIILGIVQLIKHTILVPRKEHVSVCRSFPSTKESRYTVDLYNFIGG